MLEKKPSKRRKRYPLLLSTEERARYENAAEAEERGFAEWIRRACDIRAETTGHYRPKKGT